MKTLVLTVVMFFYLPACASDTGTNTVESAVVAPDAGTADLTLPIKKIGPFNPNPPSNPNPPIDAAPPPPSPQ